jgi:hypothetical protein
MLNSCGKALNRFFPYVWFYRWSDSAAFNEHGVNAEVGTLLTDLFAQHRDTLIQHMLATGTSS